MLIAIAWALSSSSTFAQLQPRSISSLDNSLGQNRPLALEQAFPYFVSATGGRYEIVWTPAPGHYLYRHAFAFSLVESEGATPQSLRFELPDGLKKTDQFFGDIEAYYDSVRAEISIDNAPGAEASLLIEYQGCADWGFCYPPQRVFYPLNP
ncbi:MAG: protein-disulfide reductase DsbD N-terminal domain-containing protein [Pseudomonadales bacterium]|nr:protein-disulfide reductase DsbD N-terminal domain-containing protein [Pseudomonadales bacterium]